MTRNAALLGLADAIVEVDRARRAEAEPRVIVALDRRVARLRTTLARIDYPPEPRQASASDLTR